MTEQLIFDAEMLARARALGAATLHEAAGRIGALPSAIKPVAPDMRVAGPAHTVVVPMLDTMWINSALYRPEPGDVLVVSTSGGNGGGNWGDIVNWGARRRGRER